MKSFVAVLLCLLGSHSFLYEVNGDPNADKLSRDLILQYMDIVDPGNITLDIGVALVDIEFDTETDVLTASLWERYSWTDTRLSWDPSQYGGVTKLNLPEKMVWTPDMLVYNSFEGEHTRTPINAIVTSDGKMTWVPPSVLQVRCPRYHESSNDEISCRIKIGSWTHDGDQIRLKASDKSADLGNFITNNKYAVTSFEGKVNTITYECCSEPYSTYDLTIKLQQIKKGTSIHF